MANSYHENRSGRPAEIYKLIASVRNIKKRNLLRGYCAKPALSSHDAEVIRRDNSPYDSTIAGAVLKGRHGLLDAAKQKKKGSKKTCADLYTLVSFPPLEWRNEVCYSVGFINSMKARAIESLQAMRTVTHLESMDPEEALNSLLQLARTHGASNFLSYKLAYIRSTRDLSPELTGLVTAIENEICHRGSPGLHFSALENLSSKISLFVVARRRISGLTDKVQGDFRKSLTLSNFIPTPLNQADLASFLLRATESSLIDVLYAVLIIFNLDAEFESARREFELRLDGAILQQLLEVIRHCTESPDVGIVTDYYHSQNEDSDPSLDLYRTSAAFLERPQYAIYRNRFDMVVGSRLLAEIIDRQSYAVENAVPHCKTLLLSPDDTDLQEELNITLDPFYRTYLFLRYLGDQANILELKQEEIKYIFENTVGLEALLTENEIRALYIMAPPQAKSLVTVLALALYRRKSVDPDIDFEFRSDFISHVATAHGSSILEFINDLLSDSPAVANYIVGSLDEVTGTPVTPATGSTLSVKVAPLGWEIAFTGTNKRAYRSPNILSNRPYLRVDDGLDPAWTTTYSKYAKVTLAQGMSDIDTFVGARAPFDAAFPTRNEVGTGSGSNAYGGWYKWYYAKADGGPVNGHADSYSAPGDFNRAWVIIGDDRGLYLINQWGSSTGTLGAHCFTDFESYRTADGFNTLLGATDAWITATSIVSGQGPDSNQDFARTCDYVGKVLMRDFTQVGSNVRAGFCTLNTNNNAVCSSGSATGILWPNGPDYSLILHPVFLKQENNHLRGKMPGLMWIHNNSPSFNHLDVVTDVVGYPGSKFLLVKVASANGYYQELGMLAFDITGPWW